MYLRQISQLCPQWNHITAEEILEGPSLGGRGPNPNGSVDDPNPVTKQTSFFFEEEEEEGDEESGYYW